MSVPMGVLAHYLFMVMEIVFIGGRADVVEMVEMILLVD